jgi:hypothetical protein
MASLSDVTDGDLTEFKRRLAAAGLSVELIRLVNNPRRNPRNEMARRMVAAILAPPVSISFDPEAVREAQAQRYCEIGVSVGLGFCSFVSYLASIPEIPEELLKDDPRFPLLVLVEPRLGLKKLCQLGDINFDGTGDTFSAYDERHDEFASPTWIRVQDGRKHSNHSVGSFRRSIVSRKELGLTVLQGACTYLQHPQVVSEIAGSEHIMDLPGSIHLFCRISTVFLTLVDGQPKLSWRYENSCGPSTGSASRRV